MKNTTILIVGVTCLFISFISCQKEINYSETPVLAANTFTAKIDGVPFSATKETDCIRFTGQLALRGTALNGREIVFFIQDSSEHVYTLDLNAPTNRGFYNDSVDVYATTNSSTIANAGGKLSITTIDTIGRTVSGVFSMIVTRHSDGSKKDNY